MHDSNIYKDKIAKNKTWFKEMYNKNLYSLYYFEKPKANVHLNSRPTDEILSISDLTRTDHYYKVSINKISCMHRLKVRGKNLFSETLTQLKSQPNLQVVDSAMYQELKQPKQYSLAEFHGIKDGGILNDFSRYNVFYPWATPKFPNIEMQQKKLFDSYLVGQLSDSLIDMHFIKVKRVFESVQKYGIIYDKGWPDTNLISGFFLAKKDDFRFIVTRGIHRIHAIAALDYKDITVELDPQYPGIVKLADLKDWFFVKNNFISPSVAEQYFNNLFYTNE